MIAYVNMISISVRKIDNEVAQRLRARAAAHGVSMEEEVRRIIKQAVTSPENLGDIAVSFFGKKNGVELELPEHQPHQPLSFE